MRLKYDPFPLVFAQGNEATKITCLDFLGLTDSLRARECLLSLMKQQRSDGGLPSGLASETWEPLEVYTRPICCCRGCLTRRAGFRAGTT
jgi:hypothetical protein